MFIYMLSATYFSKKSNCSHKAVILRNGTFWYFSPMTDGIVFYIDYSINNSNPLYFLSFFILEEKNQNAE